MLIVISALSVSLVAVSTSRTSATAGASEPTTTLAVGGQALALRKPVSVAAAALPKPTVKVPTVKVPTVKVPTVKVSAKVSAKAFTKPVAPAKRSVPTPARVTSQRVSVAAAPSVTVNPSGYGCSSALSYLAAHSAPGFQFVCRPGSALGHQAMTCIDVAGVCPGERLIAIANPCAAAYMNEASNSWVLLDLRSGPIDPYGYCH